MNISIKIALAMSADSASFEEVHTNLEKIADDFAIGFAEWLIKKEREHPNRIIRGKQLLEIYEKEQAL